MSVCVCICIYIYLPYTPHMYPRIFEFDEFLVAPYREPAPRTRPHAS